MRGGQRPGLYARPPRPTVDGPGPDLHLHDLYDCIGVRRPTLDGPTPKVHLHNLYDGVELPGCISIIFTPAAIYEKVSLISVAEGQ